MENDEENVVDNTIENVEEQATEKLVDGEVNKKVENESTEEVEEPKIYSEKELNDKVNELLSKKIARKEDKIRREYEKKYGRAENILKAGFKTNSLEEATEKMESFYKEKGIQIPTNTNIYSDREEKILADADANEIIEGGFDEVIEEADRLKALGVDKMSSKDKKVFKKLTEYIKSEEDKKELNKIGVKVEELLKDSSFIDFSSKLNSNMSLKEKYEMYEKYKPKKEIEPIGSMKNNQSTESEVKDFYSFEEANKFSKEDFDRNPKLYEAVLKSMQKWK